MTSDERRTLFVHAGSASLEPCGVRMYGMNYVIMSNMSTCMSALCRHVTKINHRGFEGRLPGEHKGGLRGSLRGGLRGS